MSTIESPSPAFKQNASETSLPSLVGFLLLSAVFHLIFWGVRDWFSLPKETLPKPAMPIEVSLVSGSPQSPAQPQPEASPAPPKASAPAPAPKTETPRPHPIPTPPPKPKPIKPREPSTQPQEAAQKPLEPMRKPETTPNEAPSATGSGSKASGAENAAQNAPKKNPGGDFEGPRPASHMNNPKPEYPTIAIRRQWEGRVMLKVFVLANGTAGEVRVATSSGHEVLDEAAVDAVRRWRFVPAKREGQPVDSWVSFPINWNLENSR